MKFEKVGLYFFVLAIMLSIIDGAFDATNDLKLIKAVFLIFSGIVIGLVLVNEEKTFLIAGGSFVIAGVTILTFLGSNFVLSIFGRMLSNFIFLIAASVLSLGFKLIVNIISNAAGIDDTHHNKMVVEHVKDEEFHNRWSVVILIAVAVALIQLLLETFYNLEQYQAWFDMIDGFITVIFIVDLAILYKHANGMKDFVKKNFFDIIASIPTVNALRALKIIRAVKVMKVVKGSVKLSKFLKVSRTAKFFSDESGVSKYTGVKIMDEEKSQVTSKVKSKSITKSAKTTSKKIAKKIAKKVVKKSPVKKVVKKTTSKPVKKGVVKKVGPKKNTTKKIASKKTSAKNAVKKTTKKTSKTPAKKVDKKPTKKVTKKKR